MWRGGSSAERGRRFSGRLKGKDFLEEVIRFYFHCFGRMKRKWLMNQEARMLFREKRKALKREKIAEF